MQCPNCGAELKPGAKFCGKCGATVNAPAAEPAAPAATTTPTRPAPARPVTSHAAPAATPADAPSTPAESIPPAQKNYYRYDVIACRKYFANKGIVKYIAIAVIAFIIFFSTLNMRMFPSWLFFIVGIVAIFAAYMVKGVVGDTQINQIYSDISQTTNREAAQKMGLNREDSTLAKPYKFEGPRIDSEPCACFARIGSDGIVRTSNYQVTVMYAGKEAIHTYTVNQSLTFKARTPTTSDIFYDEIVRMRVVEPETASGRADTSFFELELRSGKTYYVAFLPSQRQFVLALRTLLRDKKAESGRTAQAQLEALKSL